MKKKFWTLYDEILDAPVMGGLSRTTYPSEKSVTGATLTLKKLRKLYKQTEKSGEYKGFERLYYRGIPVTIRDDIPEGEIYFVSNHQEFDEDILWAMRCMANDIERKRTWPWDRLIWRVRRMFL